MTALLSIPSSCILKLVVFLVEAQCWHNISFNNRVVNNLSTYTNKIQNLNYQTASKFKLNYNVGPLVDG